MNFDEFQSPRGHHGSGISNCIGKMGEGRRIEHYVALTVDGFMQPTNELCLIVCLFNRYLEIELLAPLRRRAYQSLI